MVLPLVGKSSHCTPVCSKNEKAQLPCQNEMGVVRAMGGCSTWGIRKPKESSQPLYLLFVIWIIPSLKIQKVFSTVYLYCHIIVVQGNASWHWHMCLQYVLVRFIPSVTLLYLSFSLRKVNGFHCSIFIHAYKIQLLYSCSFTHSLCPPLPTSSHP
jgi:hypothetical protein